MAQGCCDESEDRLLISAKSSQDKDSYVSFFEDYEVKLAVPLQAIEAVEQLNENLRQEQAMLIQSMCANHQQVLAPEQVQLIASSNSAISSAQSFEEHPTDSRLIGSQGMTSIALCACACFVSARLTYCHRPCSRSSQV